jgi:hypothetical protein
MQQCGHIYVPIIKNSFQESKKVIQKIATVGANSIEEMKKAPQALPPPEDELD